MGAPDVLLTIGAKVDFDYGQIKSDINSALKKIEGEKFKVNIGAEIKDSKTGMKSFESEVLAGMRGIGEAIRFNMSLLNDLGKTAERIANKDFTTALDFSGMFKDDKREKIAQYKAAVEDYVKYVRNAFSILQDRNGIGGKVLKETGLNLKIEDADYIFNGIKSQLSKFQSLGSLEEISKSVWKVASNYAAAFGMLQGSGVAGIDMHTLFKLPEMPVTAAGAVQNSFTSIADAIGQIQSAVAHERPAVDEATRGWAEHVPSVQAAVDAEKLKSETSSSVVADLQKEAKASEESAKAAEADAEASKKAAKEKANAVKQSTANMTDEEFYAEADKSMQEYFFKQERMAAKAAEAAAKRKAGEEKISWDKYKKELEKEEAAIEASTRKQIEQFYKAEEAKEKALQREEAAQEKIRAKQEADSEKAAQRAEKEAAAIERQYNQVLASISNTLRNVQNAKHALENTRDGTGRTEYEELTILEEKLIALRSVGTGAPLDELRGSLAALRNEMSGSLQTMNLFTNAVKDTENAERAAAAERTRNYTAIRSAYALMERLTAAQKEYARAQKDPATAEAYRRIGELKARLQGLISQYSSSAPKSFALDIKEINASFSEQLSVVQGAKGSISSYLSEGITQLTQRAATALSFTRIVMKTVQEIKKLIQREIELDSAMNSLQIVTRSSTAEMADYSRTISQMAKDTAQSTTDLINATTVYARLGYSMDESVVLAKYTAMLQGVGDIEASAAQDAMTAIIKAYGKSVDDVEEVMDKLVAVGNNFPISVSQLAEGLNNASSMLAVAGNSFDESVALLTAANTTIQNISKASTGLRTIAARIRKTTTDEEDGEIVEEAKYEEMLSALTKHKVALTDANGEYRKTYEIIKDIAAVWDDLTSMEQAAVIEALAGTRQQNIFTSLVTQFKEAESAMDRMGNSQGELMESYDIYLDSIQAHINQFKAAYDELAETFVDSELVKLFIDLGTGLVEVLNFILKAIEPITFAIPNLIEGISNFTRGSIGDIKYEYEKAQKAAEDFSKEIEQQKDKIDELNNIKSSGYITEAQEEELRRLEEQNNRYNEQLALLQQIEALKQKEIVNEANKDVSKYLGDTNEKLIPQYQSLEDYINKLEESIAEHNRTNPYDIKEAEKLRDQLNYANSEFIKASENLYDVRSWMVSAKETLLDATDVTSTANVELLTAAIAQIDEVTHAVNVSDSEGGGETIFDRYGDIINKLSVHKAEFVQMKELADEWNSLNNGNVDYFERPFITAQEMASAGWAEQFKDNLDSIATTFTSGFEIGEGENKWQIEITPILPDGNVLTPSELGKYVDRLVTDNGIEGLLASDDYGIVINAQPGEYDAEYWTDYYEKLARIKDEHLDKALTSGWYDFERALRKSGLTAEEFLEKYSDYTRKNIYDLLSLEDELDSATKKLEAFNDATKVEKGDIAAQYAQAFKKFNEDWEAGKNDSNAVKAAIDLFIPDKVQQSLDYDVKKLGNLLHSEFYQSVFNNKESDDYGANFARYLKAHAKELTDIVDITDNGDTFDIAIKSYSKLADALGVDYEAIVACADALDMYGTQMMLSGEEADALAENLGLVGGRLSNLEKVQSVLNTLASDTSKNYSAIDMRQILDQLQAAGYVDLSGIDDLNKRISDAAASQEALDDADANPSVSLNHSAFDSAAAYVNRVLDSINRRVVSPTVNLDTSGGSGSYFAPGGGASRAGGTKHAKAGETLVNELGPELISDNGRAYIANGGLPGFTNLGEGAIVFTAEETKEIFRHRYRNIPTSAMANGNANIKNRLLSGTNLRANKSGNYYGNSAPIINWSTGALYQLCPVCKHQIEYQYTGKCPYCQTYLLKGEVYNAPSSLIARTVSSSIANGAFSLVGNPGGSNASVATVSSQILKKINSGGGGGGGGGSSTSDPQKVDWIEIRLNRIQQAIQDVMKVADSAFKQLSTRLNNSNEAIRQTKGEIDTMWSAYSRYLAEAESIALPESIRVLVRNGEIDITKYDDATRQLISEYQEWYEKAIQCKSAVEDLHQELASLYLANFDKVQQDYENRLGETAHAVELINSNMKMAETRGFIDSVDFYAGLIGNTTLEVSMLEQELQDLNDYFNTAMNSGEIDEYSEAWYEMRDAINSTEEALADANIQLEEYRKNMRDVEWGYFDYAQERISKISDEANFLINLMSNDKLYQDNGQFNELGSATAGLRAVNYDTYMAQADEYAKEIKKIEQELADSPYDTALIERREELISLQQQSIMAAEAEKNAVKDLVSSGIQIELDALKDLISTYEESLDSAKDLYEYQKRVAEQSADIASLEKQLSAFQNDTSEENRARVQKLQKQLQESRQSLRETEYSQSISDQKKLLDDIYNEYEDALNSRLDNIDLLMADIINGANVNRDSINSTLQEVSGQVGYTITEGLRDVMREQFSNYNFMFEDINGIHDYMIRTYDLVSAMASASGAVKAFAKGGLVDYTGLAAVHGTPGNPEMVLSATDTAKFLEAAALMRSTQSVGGISSTGFFGQGMSGTIINGLSINIPIEHVQDYNDMIAQMQRDPKFDRLINAITLDRAVGKGSLGKYGVRVS